MFVFVLFFHCIRCHSMAISLSYSNKVLPIEIFSHMFLLIAYLNANVNSSSHCALFTVVGVGYVLLSFYYVCIIIILLSHARADMKGILHTMDRAMSAIRNTEHIEALLRYTIFLKKKKKHLNRTSYCKD